MRKLSLTHLVILLCLSVFAFSTSSIASQKDGLLKVYFLDVGQGDAIFVETPSGNQVLIDGGPDNKVLSELAKAMPFYDRDIDVVISTHSDSDHLMGLKAVLDRYEVGNIVYSDIKRKSGLYDAWQGAVAGELANIVDPVAGKFIDLGNNVVLKIIYPRETLKDRTIYKANNDSVVLMLQYGDTEILLAGDIESKAERHLVLSGGIDADILKIAHHGSKTSSTADFLSAVSPEVALISVGAENKYRHPAPEVLARLEKFGIKYYRTDLDGTIKLTSDGKNYQIIKN